ncbi:MAG: thioredoxin family protein [Candidatus Nitrosocaldaceae archaeon]
MRNYCGKTLFITSEHCPYCNELKNSLTEEDKKNVITLDVEKSEFARKIAEEFNIKYVPYPMVIDCDVDSINVCAIDENENEVCRVYEKSEIENDNSVQ